MMRNDQYKFGCTFMFICRMNQRTENDDGEVFLPGVDRVYFYVYLNAEIEEEKNMRQCFSIFITVINSVGWVLCFDTL
jgi:hypothetical protein